jgi:hypothetical protein
VGITHWLNLRIKSVKEAISGGTMKKYLVLLVASILGGAMVVGCGSPAEGNVPADPAPVTSPADADKTKAPTPTAETPSADTKPTEANAPAADNKPAETNAPAPAGK